MPSASTGIGTPTFAPNRRMLPAMNSASFGRRFSAFLLVVLGMVGSTADLTGQITPAVTPQKLQTDFRPVPGSSSNINGVLEPGESVQIAPFWTNASTTPQAFAGAALTILAV